MEEAEEEKHLSLAVPLPSIIHQSKLSCSHHWGQDAETSRASLGNSSRERVLPEPSLTWELGNPALRPLRPHHSLPRLTS